MVHLKCVTASADRDRKSVISGNGPRQVRSNQSSPVTKLLFLNTTGVTSLCCFSLFTFTFLFLLQGPTSQHSCPLQTRELNPMCFFSSSNVQLLFPLTAALMCWFMLFVSVTGCGVDGHHKTEQRVHSSLNTQLPASQRRQLEL